MKIKTVKLSDIFPYYNNPRDNAKAVQPVIESFKKFGFIKPIMVDKDMVIICGHTRYIAAFQCGCEFVPIVVSDMPEEQAKRYRMLDNKLSEKSMFDEDQLIEELRRMKAPKEMQAFFFEDIDTLMNFSYESFSRDAEASGGFEDSYTPSNDYSEDWEQPSEVKQETVEGKEDYVDPAENLFLVQNREDGTKFMKVVCPYCGNIEEIKITD